MAGIPGAGGVDPFLMAPRVKTAAPRKVANEETQLREATQEFAAILWETVLRSMRTAASGLSGEEKTQEQEIYSGFSDQAMAREVAGASGLADQLYQAVVSQGGGPTRHPGKGK